MLQGFDDLLKELPDALKAPPAHGEKIASEAGYWIGEINGRALLSAANLGFELIKRLKDTRPLLLDEIRFWAEQMSRLIADPGAFDYVTHAPSSGKVPDAEHLATILSRIVSKELRLPHQSAFINPKPRGNKGNAAVKLAERQNDPFEYQGPPMSRVLLVDDVVYTRSTAWRCINAASQHGCTVAVLTLYRA